MEPRNRPLKDGARHGWKTLRSELKYRNPWIAVREDAVRYPDGTEGIYGVVEKGPGVCVVPVDEDGVTLLRQYRHTIDAEAWELPAGSIHAGEGEAAAAARELAEEAGLRAGKLERLGRFYTALGHENAEIIVYQASRLEKIPSRPQGDESILEVRKLSWAELRLWIRENRIACGISLAALLCCLNAREP